MKRTMAWVMAVTWLAAQQHALSALAQDDLAAARAANASARNAVSTTSASTVVPGYTASPPQTVLYGQSNLGAQGRAQLALCALSPTDPSCDAQRGAYASAGMPRPAIGHGDSSVAAAHVVSNAPLAHDASLAAMLSGCPPGGACVPNRFCLGAQCFDTTQVNDPDFAQVMSYVEAAREAGVYLDPASLLMFSGEGNHCRQRLLINCCGSNSAGAGYSNQSMFGAGSRLVYDILMNGDNRRFIAAGIKSMLTSYGFSGTFTTYGVTVAVNGVALPAGSITVASTGNMVIAYDPWSLAIAVIFYAVTSMLSCNQGEGKLALKEGAGLCRPLGTWCSRCIRVLGKCVACIEHTTGKCCFNSRLARIINEQGRAQLGMGWGTAQSPSCGGFSVAQLQALDFSTMDLSAFYSAIVPVMPDLSGVQGAAATKAPACYAGGGKC